MLGPRHRRNDVDPLIHSKPSNLRDTTCAVTVADGDDHSPRAFDVAGAVKLHICRAEVTQQVTPITPIEGEIKSDTLSTLVK